MNISSALAYGFDPHCPDAATIPPVPPIVFEKFR